MAEIVNPVPQPSAAGEASSPANRSNEKPSQKRGPSVNEIYALPAPIRTFPLPAFYPNNPLSLFHIAYEWLRQVVKPPHPEPAVIHKGVWSASTISVHITDEKSVRALWEQGFYGKGSLSRSEPNWLKREKVRRGLQKTHVSEIITVQRREERIQAKWERARLEQEAIRQIRLQEEAQRAETRAIANSVRKKLPGEFEAPVGPLELLALPNSTAELVSAQAVHGLPNEKPHSSNGWAEDARPEPLPVNESVTSPFTRLGDPLLSQSTLETETTRTNDNAYGGGRDNGNLASMAQPTTGSEGSEPKTLKRQKSVRFSPKVESTTFQHSDPPSPNHSLTNGHTAGLFPANGSGLVTQEKSVPVSPLLGVTTDGALPLETEEPIVNKEHLQLLPEEVLFLTFGLGALSVTDPESGQPFSTEGLLQLFREYSYFPPRNGPLDPALQPDDEFLIHYAVYHYFRSLGWVPRAGIKFGVDWLLYARGPVFDHAEFGLVVVPSYSDPWWAESGKKLPQKTWAWLHTILRVLSHVTKSLVLVYVDIPPPPKFDKGMQKGFAEALKQYTIREVMVKRWSSKRNRS
ncbi:hypothetical protein S7711_06976 [Stachybotrys chartarum IBT 7711]|uniref:tRNA-intron lyase n=1 Tax=Stachybotrys chartarum (strain CBS 109288 / IBT 7711) TaxID=1280523 RepID=A0A084ARY7_STACB|nr:hypothetical protein S7711_06976 [Stachybotrys chartarum IBT 7711]